MNKRIGELAEQAGLEYNFDPMTWLKYEKFAELLLRDVAQFVEDKFDFCGDEITIAEKIREHFGVEE
jgi:hypothetical protein